MWLFAIAHISCCARVFVVCRLSKIGNGTRRVSCEGVVPGLAGHVSDYARARLPAVRYGDRGWEGFDSPLGGEGIWGERRDGVLLAHRHGCCVVGDDDGCTVLEKIHVAGITCHHDCATMGRHVGEDSCDVT